MQKNNDVILITRDNLNPEIFGQVVLDESRWQKKEYCQWKIDLLWWLIRQENISKVKEQQLNLLLNRFSHESIPVYFKLILEMVVFFYDELSETTIKLAISVIKNKHISIESDKYEILINKAEKLPNNLKVEIIEVLGKPTILLMEPVKGTMITSHMGSLITSDNITILTALVSSIIGITTVAIKGIKLWVDERASRKIKIRHKDLEVEIQGGIGEEELRERLSIFKEIKGELSSDNVKIIIDDK